MKEFARETEERLALYRRAARALNRFFADWTGSFCSRCLEVTARACHDDPRASVTLVSGVFPGCCHAGVGDIATVPCAGGPTPLPGALARGLAGERRSPSRATEEPVTYSLREASGRVVEGRGCTYLGEGGCTAGEFKAPLCLTYVCAGIRSAIEESAGVEVPADGEDNFCGAADVLCAVASEPPGRARRRVEDLERVLQELGNRLRAAGCPGGESLLQRWLGGESGVVRGPAPRG